MPRTPAPSTLADMQSLLDAYFRSTGTTGNYAIPARVSPTFDGLLCISPESRSSKAGCWRENPLPVRPPSPPDQDSVFAWHRTIRVSLGTQEGMIGGACIGRLPQTTGTAVLAVMVAICSTSHHLKSRIRTRYEFHPSPFVLLLSSPFLLYPPGRRQCSAFSVTTTSTSEFIDVPGRECNSIWSANVLAYAYPARSQAPAQTQPSSPTSPAQALLHPWRLLRARTSQATITGSPQRRASRAASMFTKLGRLGSWDDGESWICVEVVHTIIQRYDSFLFSRARRMRLDGICSH
jgi:hypothetical protein